MKQIVLQKNKGFQILPKFPFSFCLSSLSQSTIDDEFSKENSFEEKEEQLLHYLEGSPNQITKITQFQKYKTEICKTWQEKGDCSYRKRCLFAHGKEELMNKGLNSYKSKMCKSFHLKSYCPYGSRCLFIHENRKLNQITEKNFYMKKINSITGNCNNQNKKRLSIFKEITQKSEKNLIIQKQLLI